MVGESFNKNYIQKCCEGIYTEAFDANTCIKILLQIGEYRRSGYHSMDCSPVFYNTACGAMIRASVMDVAKIYDLDNDSISLQNIISYCNKYADCFPDEITSHYDCSDGTSETIHNPIKYSLGETELKRIKEDSRLHKEIELNKTIRRFFDLPCDPPFEIEVSAKELFKLYGIRLSQLAPIVEKLKNQRNKRYAHNDNKVVFDYEKLMLENKIVFSELGSLIDFALEVTTSIIEMLTGERKPWAYYNVDDLADTLQLVKLGREYKKLNLLRE